MLKTDRTGANKSKGRHNAAQRAISKRQAAVEVADYRHKNQKRKNNPDAGLASYNYKLQEPVKYGYDPHLDPQLIWSGKAERSSFDVATVSLHIHERVSTQAILKSVQRAEKTLQLKLFAEPDLSLDKRIEFYRHEMDWANRLILGDSLLVINSLLERELMAGKVQMIYMDPPYGVAYNSNFQPFVNRRDVRDGQDDSLTREPEQIKAYRDTWTLGIHSYLTYLRDRLRLCRELLHETGSIFVQISDQNIHHIRELMDEVFGPQNFCRIIAFKKTGYQSSRLLPSNYDYLIWYAKDISQVKYRPVYRPKEESGAIVGQDLWIEDESGRRRLKRDEQPPPNSKLFRHRTVFSLGETPAGSYEFKFDGRVFVPPPNKHWSISKEAMKRLAEKRRLIVIGKSLRFIEYIEDFPVSPIGSVWHDTVRSGFGESQLFVVQTNTKVVARCILMTTDPGELVFDPTCGSGTAAYVAEQYGRRWITCDTSRVAVAIARQRLMTARFAHYKLANPERGVSAGFVYDEVPHISIGDIAENKSPKTELLYDRPIIERDKVRVSGPFTVEAIPVATFEYSSYAAVSHLEASARTDDIARGGRGESISTVTDYVNMMTELLRKDGVTFPGGKKMVLENLRAISSAGFLHAEGEASQNGSKVGVAVSFGPRYGPVTARQVDEAIRSSYRLGFDVLVFAGFAFDPEAQATIQKNPIPKLKVHLANISPDVIVGDLLKTTRGSQLFTAFGQPDIRVAKSAEGFIVKLLGVDIYNPETGEIHSSGAEEVPAWFLDEDYDGYTFRICQAFFPKEATAKNPWDKLENVLRGVVDKEKMEMFRGTESLPFKAGQEKRIAVKVIDIRGNEVMIVKSLANGKE